MKMFNFNKKSRCLHCGRFIKKGLWNWMEHCIDECPNLKNNQLILTKNLKSWVEQVTM